MSFFNTILNRPALTPIQEFRRAVRDTFGEENLSDQVMGGLIQDPEIDSGEREKKTEKGLQLKYLAKRKLFNPFKWIEFIFCLLYRMSDALLELLYPEDPTFMVFQVEGTEPSAAKLPAWRKVLYYVGLGVFRFVRFLFHVAFKLPLLVITRITSPMRTIFRPMAEFIREHPKASIGLLVFLVLFAASVVFLLISQATLLPAIITFLHPHIIAATGFLLKAIEMLCATGLHFVVAHFSVVTTVLVGAVFLVQQIACNWDIVLGDIFCLLSGGNRSVLSPQEYRGVGRISFSSSDEEDSNSEDKKHLKKNREIVEEKKQVILKECANESAKIFRTNPDAAPMTPKEQDQDDWYAFKSFFGWCPSEEDPVNTNTLSL